MLNLQHPYVEWKTGELFVGLMKCFKCLLSKNELENDFRKLNSIDFLIFESKQKSKNKPIFIGGLKFTCLKFFQTLIKMILQFKQQIMKGIEKNLIQVGERQGINILKGDWQQWINFKLKKISQQKFSVESNYLKQMKSKIYKQVMDNFDLQVNKLSPLNLFNSLISSKIHFLQKSIYQIDKQEKVSQIIFFGEPFNIKYFGQLIHKTQRKKRNPSFLAYQYKDKLQEIFVKTNKFGNVQSQFLMDEIFCGQFRIGKCWIIVFSCGRFFIFSVEQKFIKQCQKQMQKVYDCELKQIKKEYCFEWKLKITQKKAEQVLNGPLDLLCMNSCSRLRSLAEDIISSRQQLRQKIQNMIKGNKDQPKLKTQNQNFQKHLRLIYKQQEQDQSDKIERKMIFYITKQGYFKVTGVWDQQALKNVIKKIQDQLKQPDQQLILNDRIEITANSNQNQKCKTFETDNSKLLKIEKTCLYKENKLISYYSQQKQFRKLKILTWNIQSQAFQKIYDPKQRFSWTKKRLQLIIEQILSQDADIVCIQQPGVFFIKKNQQNKYFYEDILQKLSKKYYHSSFPMSTDYSARTSIILTKFRANFYEINYNGEKQLMNKLCHFYMKVNGKEPFNTVLISIHLKANQKNNQPRQVQLKKLQKFCEQFDIIILAGDFNIGQGDKYPQNKLKFFTNFKDLDQSMFGSQKPFTCYSQKYHPVQRYDRILVRFQKNASYLNNLLIARPRQFGNFTALPYQNKFYEIIKTFTESNKSQNIQISLSDHFGRFTEIMFKTPASQ